MDSADESYSKGTITTRIGIEYFHSRWRETSQRSNGKRIDVGIFQANTGGRLTHRPILPLMQINSNEVSMCFLTWYIYGILNIITRAHKKERKQLFLYFWSFFANIIQNTLKMTDIDQSWWSNFMHSKKIPVAWYWKLSNEIRCFSEYLQEPTTRCIAQLVLFFFKCTRYFFQRDTSSESNCNRDCQGHPSG